MDRYKNSGTDTEKLLTYLTNAGCHQFAKEHAEKSEKDPSKLIKNIDTLLKIAGKFDTLDAFYTQISLYAGETHPASNPTGVKVLTIHSSKGLEFDYVFLPNWTRNNMP